VSTNSGNTGNLLEFLITPGNAGNLLEFNWSSWKFLTVGMTSKESSHIKFSSSPVVWKVVMMIMHNFMMVMFTW